MGCKRSLLLSLGLSLTSAAALAEPLQEMDRDEPHRTMAPRPVAPALAPATLHHVRGEDCAAPGPVSRRCLERRLLLYPDYRAAARQRRTGVIVTAVGVGGGGAVLAASGIAAWLWAMGGLCDHDCSLSHINITAVKAVAIAGGALVVTGLAVGLPLLVLGKSKMEGIKHRLLSLSGAIPVPALSVAPGQALVGGQWLF